MSIFFREPLKYFRCIVLCIFLLMTVALDHTKSAERICCAVRQVFEGKIYCLDSNGCYKNNFYMLYIQF